MIRFNYGGRKYYFSWSRRNDLSSNGDALCYIYIYIIAESNMINNVCV